MHIDAIRSGGQTGADRGALDAARQAGVPIRGWCPLGGWAEDLIDAPGLLASYPELVEAPSADPIVRTEWNVRDSDATLIICPGAMAACSGTAATLAFARQHGKPHYVSDGTDCEGVCAWLEAIASDSNGEKDAGGDRGSSKCRGLDLNVAGPRESGSPGIYELSKKLVAQLLKEAHNQPQRA